MSVELLDGATIVSFVEDEEAFNGWIHDRFSNLDTNHDGFLSYSEILKKFPSMRVFETHFGIDVKRDPDELAVEYCVQLLYRCITVYKTFPPIFTVPPIYRYLPYLQFLSYIDTSHS